ncbi:MAG TPA: diphosphomevalonate decarboxylase [Bdellovibrionota bacterium]|jgi:diphosphomevalonate decarboxylase|nr:diphosphomevalonate decarboxylase [Bdellovibrionota bacterium]
MIKVSAAPNIAFIKYWGKRASERDETRNIGINESVSMTLSRAQTQVEISPATGDAHEILINRKIASEADRKKILHHIERIESHFDTRLSHTLEIRSENNFPASAGIASSASAFCALTIGICAALLGKARTRELMTSGTDVLSRLARRGSGSAARSVCGGYMRWDGEHATTVNSKWQLCDTIVILSQAAKNVSSSDGHQAALTSPHFAERQRRLPERTAQLLEALAREDLSSLGEILETEALEMHHIAETSVPPVHYVSNDTRRLVAAIRALPERDFYFTIDAGPNLHLISHQRDQKQVAQTLHELLSRLNLKAEIWEDALGTGPTLE